MHNTSVTSSQEQKASSETAYGLNGSYLDLAGSASVKMEPQDYSPPTTFGLGIYQTVHSGVPVTQSLPQGWANQPVVGTSACFHSVVGAPDYNSLPYFQQQYSNGPVIGQPIMHFSGLVPHDQSTPAYYSSDISARSRDSPIYGETSSWSITPQSQVETPLRYSNGLDTKSLDQSPSLDGTESVAESDACRHPSVEGSASPSSVISRLCCEICGRRFTRKANCRDHAKRHDPKQRTAFACHECGTTFGRKTDLNRHFLTKAHDGQKKFECDKCGRSYGRLDTLRRHYKYACQGRDNNDEKHKFKPFSGHN